MAETTHPPESERPLDPLVLAAHLVPWWRSFVFRFVGLFVLVIAVLLLVSVRGLHVLARQEVEERFGLQLESVAATAALSLDGSAIEGLRTNADVGGPAFRSARDSLERVRVANGLGVDQLYVLLPSNGGWAFAVMLQPNPFVGDPYAPPPMLAERYAFVLSERRATGTRLYSDAHGTFLSGLAPVLDDAGRVVGILHVDRGVDEFLAAVQARTKLLSALGTLLLVAVILLGAFTLVRMRRQVTELLQGTEAIRIGNYQHRVRVDGTDELASVARALNDVIRRLFERFEMLKFLPRHTARMIQDVQGGSVRLEMAKRVRLVVLESDIRGFSSLSENLSPEVTIQMLNRYIRAQAEIVQARGGSIDKYMGDAVLALFDGEGMEQRALMCACEIQTAVAGMNQEGAFAVPIRIGVGLSIGDVVMGNMGSEQRMEYTIIGPTVNLAARLCSVAKPDEIVLETTLWEAAGGSADGMTADRDDVLVKGFERPVSCVRLRRIGAETQPPNPTPGSPPAK